MPVRELDRDQLISLVVQLREELKNAREELQAGRDRIAELENQLRKQSPDTRLEQEYPARQAVQRCRAGGKDRRTGQHAV